MYTDLEYTIRTDAGYRQGLDQRLARLEAAQRAIPVNNHPGAVSEYRAALGEVLRYCNLNPAPLTPLFWPRYPRDQPLNFSAHPFAIQMFEWQPSGYLVFRGSRQIGKSTAFACRQLMNARLIPGYRSLYITPRNQQLRTFKNKMREVEFAMIGFTGKRNSDLRNNLGYKEYPNNSTIELDYALSFASNIRGKSTDELLFDEAQDFDPDLEIEITQTQSASVHPITIFAGTSLTTETLLETKWSGSSQGVWITTCPHCRHDNVPLPEHRVLDMIEASGPVCVKCGRSLDIRSGRFIHLFADRIRDNRIGFHIPQIILPSVCRNPIRWAKIHEMKIKQGGDRKFLQEILGCAVEQGERELTRKHLQAICVLGSDLPALRAKALQHAYQFVVSGCDWGGADYIPAQHIKISTTVHVILGVHSTGKFDILHIRRYSGMGYDDITEDILRGHAAYNGYAIASDFGVGAVYNSKIRERVPLEKHLVFNFVGPTKDLISEPNGPHMHNQWSLNRTESISLVYEAVRQQRIRCFDWNSAEEYLTDFLNLFRAPGERGEASGGSTFLYRSHPSKPTDTLMATLYAFMLGKILLGEPMFADLSLKLRLEETLCSGGGDFGHYIPGAFSA